MTEVDDKNRGKLRDGIDTAAHAYKTARDKAAATVDASREKARAAGRRTSSTIDGNPIGLLVGGLAIGALAGAVIPRSRREKELLAPVGRRVGETAAAALAAAKDAGKSELDGLGLSRSAAKGQVKSLFDGLVRAAGSAGSAAAQAGKDKVKAG